MLASPYVARLLFGTLTGRLPNGMAPLAILLWVTANGGGLAFGGLLSALYGLAFALSQPVKGRLMDRYGQTAVHTPAAALNSALLLLLPIVSARGGTALVTAIVTTAGLSAPALEASLMIERVRGAGERSDERVACGVGAGSWAVGRTSG